MLRQHSGKVVWTLWQCHSQHWGPMLRQCSRMLHEHCLNVGPQCRDNVQAMMREHCGNLTLNIGDLNIGIDVETTFRQHCVNVVATSFSTLGTDVDTMFRQCCMNIVATSLSKLGTDIETTFRQCCVNVVSTLVCNVESNVTTTFMQHCLNVVSTSFPNVESDIATTFTQYCLVSMLVPNVGHQRWDNIHTAFNDGVSTSILDVGSDVAIMATLLPACRKICQHWALTLRQNVRNVGWMLSQCRSPMLGSILLQC